MSGGDNSRPPTVCYNFRDTGSCKFGDTCRYSHSADAVGPDGGQGYAPRRFNNGGGFRGGRGGFRRGGGGGGGGGGRPRTACFTFRDTGECKYGDTCRFLHGDAASGGDAKDTRGGGGRLCHNFRDKGSCQFGDECRFLHGDGDSRPATKPRDPSTIACRQWRADRMCSFEHCKFSHDEAETAWKFGAGDRQ